MDRRVDVAVVGAGVVGLGFAWEAARRGRRVVVFDRSPRPDGASVRGYGMVWPVGQPAGPLHLRALNTADRWVELRDRAGVWVNPCGSVHLARGPDERAVLREFADRRPHVRFLEPAEAVNRFPAVRADGLHGAVYSPTELGLDPPQALPRLTACLAEQYGAAVRFGAAVVGVGDGRVTLAGGEVWRADRVLVCTGADFAGLFPAVFAASGLRACKLQMLKTVPQPAGWRLGPHVAGGLTLPHSPGFADCPSLPAVRDRLAAECPAHARHGIRVLAGQNAAGEVVVGNSHEYGPATPFDKAEIDDLILSHLRCLVDLPTWEVAARWHGVYAEHPTEPHLILDPEPGVTVVAGLGGAGMTLAFGLAAEWWAANA